MRIDEIIDLCNQARESTGKGVFFDICIRSFSTGNSTYYVDVSTIMRHEDGTAGCKRIEFESIADAVNHIKNSIINKNEIKQEGESIDEILRR